MAQGFGLLPTLDVDALAAQVGLQVFGAIASMGASLVRAPIFLRMCFTFESASSMGSDPASRRAGVKEERGAKFITDSSACLP
jgi:hypothetical protein